MKQFFKDLMYQDRNLKLLIGLIFSLGVIKYFVHLITAESIDPNLYLVHGIGVPVLMIGYGIISALEEISDKLDRDNLPDEDDSLS